MIIALFEPIVEDFIDSELIFNIPMSLLFYRFYLNNIIENIIKSSIIIIKTQTVSFQE